MGLFSRRRHQAADPESAITEFWRWWGEHEREIAEAIPAGRLPGHSDTMTAKVHAIDPGLAWEFGPGSGSAHQLTVTAGGDPALRRIARRWLRKAPDADAVWSFHDLRQPGPGDFTLEFPGAQLDAQDATFSASRSRTGLDVQLHHPLFAQMPGEARAQVTYLLLDNVLGEEIVELWIDEITPSAAPLADPRPLAEIHAAVAEVIEEHQTDGEMSWLQLRGTGADGPIMVTCLARLSSVLAPDHDQHVAVEIPFTDVTDEGWPESATLQALHDLEDHLRDIVGGSGQHVASEMSPGIRRMHFYVDSASPAAEQVRAAVGSWEQGAVSVTATHDPSWDGVRPFRV